MTMQRVHHTCVWTMCNTTGRGRCTPPTGRSSASSTRRVLSRGAPSRRPRCDLACAGAPQPPVASPPQAPDHSTAVSAAGRGARTLPAPLASPQAACWASDLDGNLPDDFWGASAVVAERDSCGRNREWCPSPLVGKTEDGTPMPPLDTSEPPTMAAADVRPLGL